MKLNLGCGNKILQGYVNVDFQGTCDQKVDLSLTPWPWEDGSCEQILMHDFLEHFPYDVTNTLLLEAWRLLKIDGELQVQVPDFEHCALAILQHDNPQEYNNLKLAKCHTCGSTERYEGRCSSCGILKYDIANAAMKRLYGGQNYEGNFHFTAFSKRLLIDKLTQVGFVDAQFLEVDHQWANWNFLVTVKKAELSW